MYMNQRVQEMGKERYAWLRHCSNERCRWHQPMNIKWSQWDSSIHDREGAGELIQGELGLACQLQKVFYNLSLSGKECLLPVFRAGQSPPAVQLMT